LANEISRQLQTDLFSMSAVLLRRTRPGDTALHFQLKPSLFWGEWTCTADAAVVGKQCSKAYNLANTRWWTTKCLIVDDVTQALQQKRCKNLTENMDRGKSQIICKAKQNQRQATRYEFRHAAKIELKFFCKQRFGKRY